MVANSDSSASATGEASVTPAPTMTSATRGHLGDSVKVPRENVPPIQMFEPLESGHKIVKMDTNGKWRLIDNGSICGAIQSWT